MRGFFIGQMRKYNIEFRLLNKEPQNRYRRILFIGITNYIPTFITTLYNGQELRENLLKEGLFPSLIKWETQNGEVNYAEVVKTY